MPVKKRKGSPFYWYDFTVNGNRFRGSCETDDLALAKVKEASLKTQSWMQSHLGLKPSITLDAAFGRYWMEHGQYLRSKASLKGSAAHWLGYFGQDKMLNAITDNDLSAWKAAQRASMANATINRYLALLSKVKNMAANEWSLNAGEVNIRKHMMDEPQARTRWIDTKQADRLIEVSPPHLQAVIRFALLTGCRLANITGLRWEQVNLHQRVIHLTVKSSLPGGKKHTLDISDGLMALLITQDPQQEGWVFVRKFGGRRCYHHRYVERQVDNTACIKCKQPGNPQPITKFRNSWKTACKKAGLNDFRFHDLRHTAASWMRQNGVPIEVVQKVLAHANITTTMKYAHISDQETKDAMESLSQMRHIDRKAAK